MSTHDIGDRQTPSPAQARFALQHDAYIGPVGSEGVVAIYHDGERTTDRWLVDPAGGVVDVESFHRIAPGQPR
jgi:hypothetical protein